ncbi:hypothetical protein [Sporomusa sp. GT1]|uniref:hypothetical protein n=1 Tax=Sporomusa sp. GT1 TaxID=1534747 RepID=UPI001666DB43|nr:hypothetical protein [Sporomusa sp. GT1]
MSSKVAYTVYSYPPPNFIGEGDLGTAVYSGGTSGDVITESKGVVTQWVNPVTSNTEQLPGDTKVFYFKNSNGDNRAIVPAIQWGVGGAACYFMIYNADTWSDGINPGRPIYGPALWTVVDSGSNNIPITNPYKFQTATVTENATEHYYIYGIDFDNRIVFRVESAGDTYTLDTTAGHNFRLTPPTSQDSYGVDLQIVGDYFYALFISGINILTASPTYVNSTVVKHLLDFSGTPSYTGPHGTTTVNPGPGEWPGKNAFSIQPQGDFLYLVALGGMQHNATPIVWNPESKIQKVALSDLEVTNLLKAAADNTDPATDRFDFRALTFNESGSQVFILTGAYNASWVMTWRLYWLTIDSLNDAGDALLSDLTSAFPPDPTATFIATDNLSGYLWALLYSESTGKTWFARGNDLAIYGTGGIVGNAEGIGNLTTLAGSPNLNSITIYGGEVAPPAQLKGYVAPAFASSSAMALLERKRLLDEVAAAKK